MDIQRSSLLSFPLYFCQGKTMEELKRSLLYVTMELEQTKLAAQEEIKKRDNELAYLENLLTKTIQEKDDLHAKYQNLLIETLLAQQHQQVNGPISGISSEEDQQKRRIDNSNSSDCEESIVSSPPSPPRTNRVELKVPEKPLPEKGRLLEAVMRAGPLLQNLLLAGPLPEWKHPPPPLDSFEIPPVNIPSPPQQLLLHNQDSLALLNKKRPLSAADAFDFTNETKYKRLLTTSLSNSPN